MSYVTWYNEIYIESICVLFCFHGLAITLFVLIGCISFVCSGCAEHVLANEVVRNTLHEQTEQCAGCTTFWGGAEGIKMAEPTLTIFLSTIATSLQSGYRARILSAKLYRLISGISRKNYLVCSTTVPDGFMGFKLFLKTYKICQIDLNLRKQFFSSLRSVIIFWLAPLN
jgi:hypothetical protein